MMEKCVEPLQKKTMGVTFFAQNQLLTFSLSNAHSQNRPVANLPAVDIKHRINRNSTF